jgi:hypothetical protein
VIRDTGKKRLLGYTCHMGLFMCVYTVPVGCAWAMAFYPTQKEKSKK